MAKPGRSRWYKAAKWFAVAFLLVLATGAYLSLQGVAPQASGGGGSGDIQWVEQRVDPAFLLALAALCFTGLGTISSVILGWRSERRQAAESRLRVAQLELQLAEARAEAERAN